MSWLTNTLLALPPEWQNWRAEASQWLHRNGVKLVGVILLALILIQALRAATRRLARLSERQRLPQGLRAQQMRTLATVIDSVGIFIIVFLTLMQILPIFGIDMKPLLASAGIAGLAIGFGAQTLVKDVITGFFILVENQYDVGDMVRLGPVKGTVEEMTLRRTVLRDADGSVHIVPNSEIHIVTNMTRDWTQVALHVPVAYSEPSDKVIRVLNEAAQDVRNDPEVAGDIVSEPEVPGIERVSAGEVDYLLLVKTAPGAQYRVSRALRRKVKECFERNQIQVPGPTKVYVAGPEQRGQEEIK